MVDKMTKIADEIEIGSPDDMIERIEEHWFDELDISSSDYVYIKKCGKHLILGKACIELIE